MGGVSESTFLMAPSGGEDGGPTGLFRGFIHHLMFLSLSRGIMYQLHFITRSLLVFQEMSPQLIMVALQALEQK